MGAYFAEQCRTRWADYGLSLDVSSDSVAEAEGEMGNLESAISHGLETGCLDEAAWWGLCFGEVRVRRGPVRLGALESLLDRMEDEGMEAS